MNAWLGRMGFVFATALLTWSLAPSLATQHGQSAYSQQAGGLGAAEGQLQMQSTMLPTGVQQLTVLDTRARSLAIYHIEPQSGKIQLRSVRNLVLDLQMEHFNGQAPLPSELRQVQP